MQDFAGKVAAITGAGSGIGRALAYELARYGARLALSDIDEDAVRETAALALKQGASETVATRVDVSDRHAVQAWADETAGYFGTVNLVVNNAGVALTATVEEMEWDDFEWLMGINFWGVAYGTKAFLPHLRRSRDAHIVNISSVFGLMGIPTQSAYCAAKYAVRGFTESLRQEMRMSNSGIRVTTVHPGGIKTNIARSARAAQGLDAGELAVSFDRLARTSPDRAARIILRGVKHNRARVFVGPDATAIDIGQRALGVGLETLVRRFAGRSLPLGPARPAATTRPGTKSAG
ncbi:SDR family NAD(P)-dependent oxidoreductase [Yinghuangia seranimata]|uniref:SDR family NAD(P)-dependent oxidoreductase n=1 Tax=Yinghuangia seranimata TaxID=408067 RepID=UPI00248AA436|nr:SDR family NAD(P)-dependent oxidoreductase [Yinghuangia seranimata]MDI2129809.1 SDR family NAD(P)-dependent oxidoreductase [Yinghuangia seranimata]